MKIGPNMLNLVPFFLLKYPVAQMFYGIVYQQLTLFLTLFVWEISALVSVYISKT